MSKPRRDEIRSAREVKRYVGIQQIGEETSAFPSGMIEVKPFAYGVATKKDCRDGVAPHFCADHPHVCHEHINDMLMHEELIDEFRDARVIALYGQSTIDALQARIAELEKDAGRLRKHIQQVAETHEEMRVKWHKLSLTPFDTEENKTIVLQRVKEQKLLRDIHLAAIDAAIAKENNG